MKSWDKIYRKQGWIIRIKGNGVLEKRSNEENCTAGTTNNKSLNRRRWFAIPGVHTYPCFYRIRSLKIVLSRVPGFFGSTQAFQFLRTCLVFTVNWIDSSKTDNWMLLVLHSWIFQRVRCFHRVSKELFTGLDIFSKDWMAGSDHRFHSLLSPTVISFAVLLPLFDDTK